MDCDLHWVDYAKALLTPCVALLGISIAFVQYRINKSKLQLEKFSLRVEVYNGVRQYLDEYFKNGKVEPEEIFKLKKFISQARWLFGKEVTDYLNEDLLKNSTRLHAREKMAASNGKFGEFPTSETANVPMLEQYQKLDKVMSKYLSLS